MHDRSLRFVIGPLLLSSALGAIVERAALAQQARPSAKQPAAIKQDARTDANGDLLPPGAVARAGTLRDYIGNGSSRGIFSDHGKYVTASAGYDAPRARLWDPVTGRVDREFPELDRSVQLVCMFQFVLQIVHGRENPRSSPVAFSHQAAGLKIGHIATRRFVDDIVLRPVGF